MDSNGEQDSNYQRTYSLPEDWLKRFYRRTPMILPITVCDKIFRMRNLNTYLAQDLSLIMEDFI